MAKFYSSKDEWEQRNKKAEEGSVIYPWEQPNSIIKIARQPEWEGPWMRKLELLNKQYCAGIAGDAAYWDKYHELKYYTPEENAATDEERPELWAERIYNQLVAFTAAHGTASADTQLLALRSWVEQNITTRSPVKRKAMLFILTKGGSVSVRELRKLMDWEQTNVTTFVNETNKLLSEPGWKLVKEEQTLVLTRTDKN